MNAENNRNVVLLRLQQFPITSFAVVLGFAGFALAVQKGSGLFSIHPLVSTVILNITLGLFFFFSLLYMLKMVFFFSEVRAEFSHPIKINFFPLVAKILLVLSIVFIERDLSVSYYMWIAGAAGQLVASLVIISTWIHHTQFRIEHMTPAWFIPIVGSLIIPIAGVKHGFTEMSWFFFSVGLIFWLMLFIIVMYRMIFHQPMMEKLVPTLFILFAPPAIAFIAYIKLTGGFDSFARILYSFSLFLFFLVLFKIRVFFRIRFFLSWWAYSFPLAAKTLATILMYHLTGSVFYRVLAITEFSMLAITIIILVLKTARAVAKKEICVEES